VIGLLSILWVTAAAGDPSFDPNPWAQLGIASIVCALLFAWGLSQWRDNKVKDAKIEALNQAALLREREMGNSVIPVLKEAVGILSAAPAQFDRALGEARDATRGRYLEDLTRRLEDLVQQIGGR
jgi:hypothetical protein